MDIESFINELKKYPSSATVTNMYADDFEYHEQTVNNLRRYLNEMLGRKPTYLFVGEAPGPHGCRFSGIPFTSEDILATSPFFAECNSLWSVRDRNNTEKENTASVVWKEFDKTHFYPLLWNAFPFHPHKEGNKDSIRSPTKTELNSGKEYIAMLQKMFIIKDEDIYAVGRKAQESLDRLYIRHPSHAGQKEFCAKVDEIVKRLTDLPDC